MSASRMAIQTVAIIGVGLIGGSLGLALRARGFAGRILGVSSARTIEAALARGAVDVGVSLEEAVPRAELVILAQPIGRIVELLPQVRRLASSSALVTDVGSTKARIVEAAAAIFGEGPWFVGGHPMAGKEKRGVELADADLFEGATYVLTPIGPSLPAQPIVEEWRSWICRMGANVLILPAELHDRTVTWTSHLPQLASSALAACLLDEVPSEERLRVAGSGLRGMIRLAESPYAIWRDIFETNQAHLEQALTQYIRRLEEFRESLRQGDLGAEFEMARKLPEKIRASQKDDLDV